MLGVVLTTIAFAIVPVSIRMRGLNPGLVGVVDDEYSDLFFNPAYINRIEGNRVYTNLSNIHNFGQDLLLDPTYSPDMYYNLLGGVTNYNDLKLGGILETGGYKSEMTENDAYKEIQGSSTYYDSINYDMTKKNLATAFDIFLGKKVSSYDVGLVIGPKCQSFEVTQKYNEEMYEYSHDTMIEHDHITDEVKVKDGGFSVPFMLGMVTGEPDNEYSACLSFGYENGYSLIPEKFLMSDMVESSVQYLNSYSKFFDKYQEEDKYNGIIVGLNGRNKRRMEDHSVSYLANLTYAHQPITMNAFESIYHYMSPSSGFYTESESIFSQTADGSQGYLTLSLGVGAEKYFDAMSTENMFAIGVFPSFIMGSAKLNYKPVKMTETYWDNTTASDTYAFSTYQTDGEYLNVKQSAVGIAISVPLGLETHLTDKLVLRLGATEDFMLKYTGSSKITMADSGWKYTYTQTMPYDTVISESEPTDELDSYTIDAESKYSWNTMTSYYYGLGYRINRNIELNFLNYAQLTDLRCWVLGVNIKF